MNKRVYVDLEYCYPGMTKQTGRPSEDDLRQVVQIAAICYDHDAGEELNSFNVLAYPPYTKELPSFFIELTGITQKSVDEQAISFSEALKKFIKFCHDLDIYTFDKDWYVLKQNCSYYNMDYPFETMPFIRIREALQKWGVPDGKYSSGTLYKASGLKIDGHVHNALHDVRSMAAAAHHFEHL